MDLEAEILSEHSKRNTVRIAKWIGSDRQRFKHLIELFLHGEYVVTQRSAWIVGECYEQTPELLTPWLPALLKKMQEPDVHDAVKRNIVRILQSINIPKNLLGTVVSLCFDYINSYDTPIAVKAFSMTVLANAVEREPALKNELAVSLKLLLESPSGGIRARARMMSVRLEKLEKKKSPDSNRWKI